jgi:hypothetical protein
MQSATSPIFWSCDVGGDENMPNVPLGQARIAGPAKGSAPTNMGASLERLDEFLLVAAEVKTPEDHAIGKAEREETRT